MRPALPRRRLLAAVPLGLAASGALGVRAQTPGAPIGNSPAVELRIGAVYPLSGAPSLLGDESFRGLEMAVEERNAAGGVLGRPLRLLRADVADEAAAVAEVRRLAGPERATALFGTYASSLSMAATQASEAQGVPFFELGAIADGITERGLRHLFRTCPRAADFAHVLAGAVSEVLPPLLGLRRAALRVGLLHEDGPDGSAIAEGVASGLREAGVPVAERIGYPAGGSELAGSVQRLREAGAAVLLHAAGGNDIIPFFRALRETGWAPRMILGAGAGYGLTDTAHAVGPAFEGVMSVDVTGFAIAGRVAPGNDAFTEAYKRRYGSDPRSGHSLANHFGANIALDAIQRAGGTEKDRLRAAVLATDVATGTTAAGWGATFDERGQNTRARPWLMQWQDGRLVTIHPEAAAVAPPRARPGTD